VTLESNTDPVSSPFVGVKSIARGGLRRAISHTRTIVVDYGLGAGYDHFAARGVVGRGRLASKLQSDVSSGTGPQRQSQLPSLPWLIYSKFQSERVGRALICYSFSQIYNSSWRSWTFDQWWDWNENESSSWHFTPSRSRTSTTSEI
jgi:hypothetical protein